MREGHGFLPRHGWLLAILVVGTIFRVYRLAWGLPDFVPPDSLNYYIRPAARLVAAGELIPPSFIHTPLFVYTIALVDLVWSQTFGGPIDLSPRPLQGGFAAILPSQSASMLGSLQMPPQLATLILVARVYCVMTAILSIAVLYLLVRRLAGVRAALFAAAIFALCPLHVLESHRVNADGVMILFALLAAHRTVVAVQTGSRRGILGAFALAAVAGAVRYNGLAIFTLPVWAVLRWAGTGLAERFRLLMLGSAIFFAVVGICLLPALFDWQAFKSAAETQFAYGFVAGGNLDLSGEGWVFHRYIYQLVVSLPFAMGWPAYLCAMVGLLLLARSDSRSCWLVLAAIGPFFLVQGGALTVEHRYFQLVLPFLALTAGVTLDTLLAARWRFGTVLVIAVLGYTAALAGSHCLRLGLAPQRAVADFLREPARVAAASGDTLGFAYPGPVDLLFDPLRTQINDPAIQLRHVPLLVAEAGAPPTSDEQLAQHLHAWVTEKSVDVVVLPNWQEGVAARSRGSAQRNDARIFRLLSDGTLQFRQAAHFPTRYLTDQLYTWADPLLKTHRATGILGYKVFVRTADDLGPGLDVPAPPR